MRFPILLAMAASLAGPAFAQGDAANGEKVFRKCQACHAVGEGARNKVGPMLNGIIGAPFASVEGFRYSKALEEKRDVGMVWDEATLAAYLENPREAVPGGRMSFAGLKKESDQADVIAYLAGFAAE